MNIRTFKVGVQCNQMQSNNAFSLSSVSSASHSFHHHGHSAH